MDWTALWIKIFGRTEFLGLNMGFWAAVGAVLMIVIIMTVVFWSMKPLKNSKSIKTRRIFPAGFSYCRKDFTQHTR